MCKTEVLLSGQLCDTLISTSGLLGLPVPRVDCCAFGAGGVDVFWYVLSDVVNSSSL